MPQIIIRTIARFNKRLEIPVFTGDIAIYRRECAGRVYHVKGIMVGATVLNGECRWQIQPVYEWDAFDYQWVSSKFNRVHTVDDADVLHHWNGALS